MKSAVRTGPKPSKLNVTYFKMVQRRAREARYVLKAKLGLNVLLIHTQVLMLILPHLNIVKTLIMPRVQKAEKG